MIGEKDLALKQAKRAMMLLPSAKDPMVGPAFEENLAVIQTIFGENSRPISTLTQLLQTPYDSCLRPCASYASAFTTRSGLGPFARRSRFPKTLRGKAAARHAVAPFSKADDPASFSPS